MLQVDIIQSKTLSLLRQQGIPAHRVYIFVADAEEYEKYHRAIGRDWPNIVIGVRTLWRQRNFITEFFKEGTHIVSWTLAATSKLFASTSWGPKSTSKFGSNMFQHFLFQIS